MIDLFPTILDIIEKKPLDKCIQGKSLYPILLDSQVTTRPWALSQFPRCWSVRGKGPSNRYSNPCMRVDPKYFEVMGYSLRTKEWRYTEWRRWDGESKRADWSSAGLSSVELYAHSP